jgi:hypothetical protein
VVPAYFLFVHSIHLFEVVKIVGVAVEFVRGFRLCVVRFSAVYQNRLIAFEQDLVDSVAQEARSEWDST